MRKMKSGMNICFITDPLVTTAGAVRPPILLAREFHRMGHNIIMVTPHFNERIKKQLDSENIRLLAVGPKSSFFPDLPTFKAWARCLIRHNMIEDMSGIDFVVNASSSVIASSHVYYAQGLMMEALDDMLSSIPLYYRLAYSFLGPMLRFLERKMVNTIRRFSRFFIANSYFCASMYRRLRLKVDGVINPPLDSSFFKPSTPKPAQNYVLTYFGVYGKEGVYRVMKTIADAGVSVKAFGFASSYMDFLKKHPNIEFLGRVTDEYLVELYSNALFTLFSFTHEPFGYIPIESMACGTPVLTYNRQGPSETVVHNETGWLVNEDHQMVALAVELWRKGYDSIIRRKCRERALDFDIKEIFTRWVKILSLCEGEE
jgi:glycosyltransferase involved in cell wall biosynthesis